MGCNTYVSLIPGRDTNSGIVVGIPQPIRGCRMGSISACKSVAHAHAEVFRRCRERLRLLDARVEPLEEMSARFQFVSERVDVIDDWLNSRFGQ